MKTSRRFVDSSGLAADPLLSADPVQCLLAGCLVQGLGALPQLPQEVLGGGADLHRPAPSHLAERTYNVIRENFVKTRI